MAEQLICNQQVVGSTPITSSNTGAFPSGQRGQTVNLLSLTSVVRIHPLPPEKSTCESKCFFQRNPPAAEEIHLRWMKSLRDEIPLCGEMEADFISSEAVGRRFHPSSARISSCEARFHYDFGGPNPPMSCLFCWWDRDGKRSPNARVAVPHSSHRLHFPRMPSRRAAWCVVRIHPAKMNG